MNQLHPFCNNANCAIRRSLWLEQPYDETLTGLEDLYWAKKMQAKGHRISYQAGSTIIHVHEERWRNVFNRYRREAIALRLIQKNETFNFLTFLTLFWKTHDTTGSRHCTTGYFYGSSSASRCSASTSFGAPTGATSSRTSWTTRCVSGSIIRRD